MSTQMLHILIEGNDDERFFKYLEKKGVFKDNVVVFWKYSEKKKEKVNGYLKAINSMGADYLFVTDFDNYDSTNKIIGGKLKEFKNLDHNCIVVVRKMIESWYMAGIDSNCPKILKRIKIPKCTENLDKNYFACQMPNCFENSRIDFMNEILKCYNMEEAQKRNNSFKSFLMFLQSK